MTRTVPRLRPALAAVTIVLLAVVYVPTGAPAVAVPASGGTALPAGWELCVIQGLQAPVTGANVADLDQWQAAEGGSTNNSAAYNPFNTMRTTDATGAALPATLTSNGFPAFTTWLAGCAATVATLLQPNMSSITASLRAGDVSPPGAFLAAVDQSQWCAPSDGTPCYLDTILRSSGGLATSALLASSALDVFGNVQSDVRSYQLATAAVAADQGVLAAKTQALQAAVSSVSAAESVYAVAGRTLQKFAIDEYVSSGLYVSTSYTNVTGRPNPFGPQNADGVVAQEYKSVATSDLVGRYQAAASAVSTARAERSDAAKAMSKAALILAADEKAENRSVVELVGDLATMQRAGACTAVALTVSTTAPGPPVPITPLNTPAPPTPTTTVPTTTPTTAPAPTPAPTTTTTSSTTTTTTTLPVVGSASRPTPPTTTTTTTVSPTTLPPTTTVPTTTTTTTTTLPPAVPTAPSGSVETPNPAGLGQLTGCIASLAPPAT